MANNNQLRGTPFSATASGTTSAQAVTTVTDATYYISDISGTSTTAGTWVILGGATGTTVLWQGTGNVNTPVNTSLLGPVEGTVSFLVNGATNTFANISGYYYTPD